MAIAAGIVLLLGGAWTMVGYNSTKGIETPKYTVIEKRNGYEIREYAPYLRAEVTLSGSYRDTLYGGFRDVAGFIFGANTAQSEIAMTAPVLHERSEKIAMTAPVLHEKSGEETYTLSFIMPSQYTLESLPKPTSPNVAIREIPAARFAVMKFGGYATKGRAERKIERLQGLLNRDGVKSTAPAIVAQYDPPWTPPFMRKNEIQIPLN